MCYNYRLDISVNAEDTKMWEKEILGIPGAKWSNLNYTLPKVVH
jgi:hypothetical protein